LLDYGHLLGKGERLFRGPGVTAVAGSAVGTVVAGSDGGVLVQPQRSTTATTSMQRRSILFFMRDS
jgi:hypothetical protein